MTIAATSTTIRTMISTIKEITKETITTIRVTITTKETITTTRVAVTITTTKVAVVTTKVTNTTKIQIRNQPPLHSKRTKMTISTSLISTAQKNQLQSPKPNSQLTNHLAILPTHAQGHSSSSNPLLKKRSNTSATCSRCVRAKASLQHRRPNSITRLGTSSSLRTPTIDHPTSSSKSLKLSRLQLVIRDSNQIRLMIL